MAGQLRARYGVLVDVSRQTFMALLPPHLATRATNNNNFYERLNPSRLNLLRRRDERGSYRGDIEDLGQWALNNRVRRIGFGLHLQL